MKNGPTAGGTLGILILPMLGAWAATPASSCIRAVKIHGELQIKYSDGVGKHALRVDSRNFLPDELPADAEITVLDGDAVFECAGARLSVLSGTVFEAAQDSDRGYIYVKTGELLVSLHGETKTLDRHKQRFSFLKSQPPPDDSSRGFLR